MAYQNKSFNNLVQRSISASILAPLVYYIIQCGGIYFTAFMVFIAVICGGEWFNITKEKGLAWKISGTAYISFACYALIWLINTRHVGIHNQVKLNGISLVTSIFLLVAVNDIGAYFFGKLIGGPKLCPKISPNKTWSGFFGGAILTMSATPLLYEYLPIVGFFIAVFATLGDALESWAKRKCEVKDSSNLIPGHGGFLDRVDGIFMVAIVVFLLVNIFG